MQRVEFGCIFPPQYLDPEDALLPLAFGPGCFVISAGIRTKNVRRYLAPVSVHNKLGYLQKSASSIISGVSTDRVETERVHRKAARHFRTYGGAQKFANPLEFSRFLHETSSAFSQTS